MADLGRALLSKIIADDDLVTALSAGIKASWFEDDEYRAVFKWMTEFFTRYNDPPTKSALTRQFPNFQLVRVREPYEYYIDEFRALRQRNILVDTVIDANTALEDDDPKKAQAALSQGLMDLGREVTSLTDEDAISTMDERLKDYDESRHNVGVLTGIPTGFPTLDFVTGGFHEQQFVVLGGAPKQGKSFLMMRMAIAAQDAGKRGLRRNSSFGMTGFGVGLTRIICCREHSIPST
jgi:replicative DNA helicase